MHLSIILVINQLNAHILVLKEDLLYACFEHMVLETCRGI